MRITRLFVLLALAALLAPRAEASRASVWESNPSASLTATRADAAGLLASLAPAAPTDIEAEEPHRFDLGDITLVESAREHEGRFNLGPLTLVDLNLLRGPPPSYPETRVGGFELLPPFRVGASATLSLWGRQACGFSCREVASDSRYDPWGLATDCSRSENPENCRAFQAISARVATERLNGDSVPPVPEAGRDETPGRLGRLWSAWNDLGDRAGRAWRNLWSSNAEPTELQREAGDERYKTGPALGRAVGEIGEPPIRYGTKAAQFVVENKAVTLAVGGVAAAVSTVRRTRSGGLVVLGELDEFGRATGVRARITPDMIGSGTRASSSIRPAGFVGQPGRQHRGHLLGKQLGGVGDDPRNLISMFDSGNTPTMRDFENAVRKAVESGETVDYWAIPVYEGANPLAKGVTLKARGSGGFSLDVSVLNKL